MYLLKIEEDIWNVGKRFLAEQTKAPLIASSLYWKPKAGIFFCLEPALKKAQKQNQKKRESVVRFSELGG